MTDADTTAVDSPESDIQEPKWWATHTIGGREIHFNPPSPEQLMVMRRLARELESPNVGRAIVSLGKVLDAVSTCMGTDEERDFVDDLVMSRKIDMEELAPLIRVALMGPRADKIAKPVKKKAQRARRRT